MTYYFETEVFFRNHKEDLLHIMATTDSTLSETIQTILDLGLHDALTICKLMELEADENTYEVSE